MVPVPLPLPPERLGACTQRLVIDSEDQTDRLTTMTTQEIRDRETTPDYPLGKPDILNNIVDFRAKRSPRAL